MGIMISYGGFVFQMGARLTINSTESVSNGVLEELVSSTLVIRQEPLGQLSKYFTVKIYMYVV